MRSGISGNINKAYFDKLDNLFPEYLKQFDIFRNASELAHRLAILFLPFIWLLTFGITD